VRKQRPKLNSDGHVRSYSPRGLSRFPRSPFWYSGMPRNRPCTLLSGLLLTASAYAATPLTLPSEDRILPSSLELERRTEPWCPADCAVAVPFVASYHKGREHLVFVGVRHAFNPNDPTMRAVATGLAQGHPKVVIVEGFPTAMGESPPPLVEEARRYGAPDASDFDRGEAIYAASLALSKHIPFLGGEPTRNEENQALKAHGFTDADMAFSALLGWYSQSLRSGDIPDTSAESLMTIYPKLAGNIRAPTDLGGWNIDAPSLEDFRQHYRELYGLDIVGDTQFPLRIDVGDTTRHGQQARVDMMTRDRHLLGLIEQQLADRNAVLVVYGGSHWATLSAALEHRLGKPKVTPFLQ